MLRKFHLKNETLLVGRIWELPALFPGPQLTSGHDLLAGWPRGLRMCSCPGPLHVRTQKHGQLLCQTPQVTAP